MRTYVRVRTVCCDRYVIRYVCRNPPPLSASEHPTVCVRSRIGRVVRSSPRVSRSLASAGYVNKFTRHTVCCIE